MQINAREFFTATHGLLFGGFFLLAIFGLLVESIRSIYATETSELTGAGRSLATAYLVVTAILGWAAVLAGHVRRLPLVPRGPPDWRHRPDRIPAKSFTGEQRNVRVA